LAGDAEDAADVGPAVAVLTEGDDVFVFEVVEQFAELSDGAEGGGGVFVEDGVG
jgi:hypothetical protein